MIRPSLWNADRQVFESRMSSRINKDDYIVGENKSLLYIHPDLTSQRNVNFLKRSLYFAGKTGDRIYRKKKKDLLTYLSEKGETAISLVLKAVDDSLTVDISRTVVVGPKKQLKREMNRKAMKDIRIEDQGDSIGENIVRGKEALREIGYSSDKVLIIGGDLPLLRGSDIDEFVERARIGDVDPDIRFGMGSRRELAKFIKGHDIDFMGPIGPNYPKAGYLNKFGIPLMDDRGVFGKKNRKDHFMMGNIFMARFDRIDPKFIDRFYSLRKMAANPLSYPYLLYHFGGPLFRAMGWKLSVSEAERIFSRSTGVIISVTPASPEFTLDLDSYSDLRRLSALYYHRMKTTHDLELDFRKYVKERKSERKKARRRKNSLERGVG
jgi:hypothetical protein